MSRPASFCGCPHLLLAWRRPVSESTKVSAGQSFCCNSSRVMTSPGCSSNSASQPGRVGGHSDDFLPNHFGNRHRRHGWHRDGNQSCRNVHRYLGRRRNLDCPTGGLAWRELQRDVQLDFPPAIDSPDHRDFSDARCQFHSNQNSDHNEFAVY